jgi:poly-gamma-glutamate capsule biosynthesis protein CapA/YwtB (metallophosphatase superfamily)
MHMLRILFVGTLLAVAPLTIPGVPERILEYVRPAPPPEASVVFVGDIMLSRTVAKKMRERGADFPFSSTTDITRRADIAFGNLETTITEGEVVEAFEMRFRADAHAARVLKDAGFDVLSLANNHTFDFGEQGLLDTLSALDREGIIHVGAGKDETESGQPMFINANGIQFAFLAFTDQRFSGREAGEMRTGAAFMREDRMKAAVAGANTFADIVIVSMHSGIEYEHAPDEVQVAFARAAIDAGADIVIGHHPHVVQSAEVYQGKPIFYSLGNFVFDQMWSEETRTGLALEVVFGKEGVLSTSFHPTVIEEYARPRPAEEKRGFITERLGLGKPVDRLP